MNMNKPKAVIHKKDLIPLWIIIGIFVLITIYFGIKIFGGGGQIKDQNGDTDKTLCVITDGEIEATISDYSAVGNYTSFTDKASTGVDSKYELHPVK